jgi:predicted PurR-regulated permease PerM
VDVRQMPRREPVAEPDEGAPIASLPWKTAARIATVGIFFLLFCAVLELAQTILLPVVSGLVIGTMLGPVVTFGARLRLPQWLSATLVTAAFIAFIALTVTLMSTPIVEWIGRAPDIGNIIREKFQVFERPLAALNELRAAITPKGAPGVLQVDVGPSIVAPALTIVTPAVGELIVFFGTLFFYLMGRDILRRSFVQMFGDRDLRLRVLKIFNDVERSLTDYLSLVTVINMVVGLGAAVIAYVAGLPNALVFGLIAFILNYIPYVGPLIMNVVFFAIGVVTFPTLAQALIAPACFVTMTTLEGHFITPAIMGRRLTLNPLNVFLALAFWTWLWGPVGAFLAVPLLITALVILKHVMPKAELNLPA